MDFHTIGGETVILARMRGWSQVVGGLVLGWCLLASVSGLRAALARDRDHTAEQDADFRVFGPDLPPLGTIGFLQPFNGWNDDTVRLHYAAQYSLAPRVIVEAHDHEFIIVAKGAERPDGEPRLAGYVRVASLPSGHRLFRRAP